MRALRRGCVYLLSSQCLAQLVHAAIGPVRARPTPHTKAFEFRKSEDAKHVHVECWQIADAGHCRRAGTVRG